MSEFLIYTAFGEFRLTVGDKCHLNVAYGTSPIIVCEVTIALGVRVKAGADSSFEPEGEDYRVFGD